MEITFGDAIYFQGCRCLASVLSRVEADKSRECGYRRTSVTYHLEPCLEHRQGKLFQVCAFKQHTNKEQFLKKMRSLGLEPRD